jgi:hypothetical protein
MPNDFVIRCFLHLTLRAASQSKFAPGKFVEPWSRANLAQSTDIKKPRPMGEVLHNLNNKS